MRIISIPAQWLFVFLIISFELWGQEKQGVPSWLSKYTSHELSGNLYIVKKRRSYCGIPETYLATKDGKILTPAYRDIGSFHNGLAEFVLSQNSKDEYGLHGFLNRTGQVVIPAIYSSVGRFQEGKAWVIKKSASQFGMSYIDSTGQELYRVPTELFPNHYQVQDVFQAYSCGRESEESLFWPGEIDPITLSPRLSNYSNSQTPKKNFITPIHFQGRYGFMNSQMILKVPVVLEDIDSEGKFSDNLLQRVRYNGKYGFISKKSAEILVTFIYDDSQQPAMNRIWVKKDKHWGCIDHRGKTVIPFRYDHAGSFSCENRASVSIGNKFGHIDTSGRVTTELKYELTTYFNNGIALAKLKGEYIYIGLDGMAITSGSFRTAKPFKNGYGEAEGILFQYLVNQSGSKKISGISLVTKVSLVIIGTILFIYFSNILMFLSKTFAYRRIRNKVHF